MGVSKDDCKKEGQWIKTTTTTMKQFLKSTWTSYSDIYFIKEDRKRNCLKCQFCLFFVSLNAKQVSRMSILSVN